MRFVVISLLIDCLLFFGISYLAFGNTEVVSTHQTCIHQNVHCIDDMSCGSSFENGQKFFIKLREIGCVVYQNTTDPKTDSVSARKKSATFQSLSFVILSTDELIL